MVMDCDTYRRCVRGGYRYRFKSTFTILVLPLVEWTECRVGVQAIIARHN